MIHLGTRRYLYTWHVKKERFFMVEIGYQDKVIIKLRNKSVISGILCEIGTKNIAIETRTCLVGKTRSIVTCKRIKIDDIEDFAKYPKEAQRYGTIKLN